MSVIDLVGPHGYIHGWIKVGPGGSLPEGDPDARAANAALAKTGVLKRATRQSGSIGGGLAVAGGSSDLERPVADALTRAAQTGRDHYIIPTARGYAATSSKSDTRSMSGFVHITPAGDVTKMERTGEYGTPHEPVARLSDHTVSGVLERQLSKTQKATPRQPAAKPKAKDPDVQPRSAVARLVKDMQKNPALQTPEFKARAREIAGKSGASDLIPQDWANEQQAIELARAITPMKDDLARKIRATAASVDKTHPETVASQHLRNAATLVQHGQGDGAKRHLDAAMELMTPRNLIRHGITDDEGHATAKTAMHQMNVHRLGVMDIQDAQARNNKETDAKKQASDQQDQAKQAAAAAKQQATPPQPPASGQQNGGGQQNQPPASPPGKQPPGQQNQQASAGGNAWPTPILAQSFARSGGNFIDLVGPKGYVHGWIKVADGIEQTAGKIRTGNDARAGTTVRADRVVTFLHRAADAARTGDHATALTMLNRAHSDTLGSSARQRVPSVMVNDGSAAGPIGEHIKAVTAASKPPPAKVKKISAAESRRRRQAAQSQPPTSLAQADSDAVTELSARTAALEVTPAPYGKPGGPGLYGKAGNKHSDYFEQIVTALMAKRGMDKATASKIAWGALRKWRAGGGGVHPEVRAAAAGALVKEAAAGARAALSSDWDAADQLIDLAAAQQGGSNARSQNAKSQARVPKGQPGGGQFGTGGKGKPGAVSKGSGSHAAEKHALLAKAATIRGQIKALAAQIKSANSTAAKSPAAAAASAKKAASTKAAPAASTAAKAAKSTTTASSTPTVAQMTTQMTALRGQLAKVMAQIHQLG